VGDVFAVIADAGERAGFAFVGLFTTQIRTTRPERLMRSLGARSARCDAKGYEPIDIDEGSRSLGLGCL
jgi:hypothetical protein